MRITLAILPRIVATRPTPGRKLAGRGPVPHVGGVGRWRWVGTGAARACLPLGAGEEWGRGRGTAIAVLDTYVDSPVSVPFYEQRMGYSRQELRFRKWLV